MSPERFEARVLWIVMLGAATVAFSFAMACATPFAAIAALGALALNRADAYFAAGLAFLINQAVGFGFLGYPLDAMTIAWGAAIGVSALSAVAAARVAAGALRPIRPAAALAAFAAALLVQQLTIYAASFVLTAHPSAFALPVLLDIASMNALAFLALGVLQAAGARIGVARSPLGQPAG